MKKTVESLAEKRTWCNNW